MCKYVVAGEVQWVLLGIDTVLTFAKKELQKDTFTVLEMEKLCAVFD